LYGNFSSQQFSTKGTERLGLIDYESADFEWSISKAASNLSKHQVSFKEATTIFADFGLICYDDREHSVTEERQVAIGYSSQNRLLTVSFTERDNGRIRIISARKPTPSERKLYENS
jgi:uncharacterized DUF497 family protein